MVNAKYVYLRSGNLFKKFAIESDTEYIGGFGRPKANFKKDDVRTLTGCLADAMEEDRERWRQLQHTVTHTVVQSGYPKAKEEDRLVLDDRVFIIHGVDDCGGLGITTIYFVEERHDVR